MRHILGPGKSVWITLLCAAIAVATIPTEAE